MNFIFIRNYGNRRRKQNMLKTSSHYFSASLVNYDCITSRCQVYHPQCTSTSSSPETWNYQFTLLQATQYLPIYKWDNCSQPLARRISNFTHYIETLPQWSWLNYKVIHLTELSCTSIWPRLDFTSSCMFFQPLTNTFQPLLELQCTVLLTS